jgi:hypothetical protein
MHFLVLFTQPLRYNNILSNQGVDAEWCMHPDKGLIRPDLVFQIKVDIDKLAERENYGSEVNDKDELQKTIRDNYKKMFHSHRYWKLIEPGTIDVVHKNILNEIQELKNKYDNISTENQEVWSDFEKNFYPKSIGEDLFMYDKI